MATQTQRSRSRSRSRAALILRLAHGPLRVSLSQPHTFKSFDFNISSHGFDGAEATMNWSEHQLQGHATRDRVQGGNSYTSRM
jgi:hypothetical protein